MTERSVNESLTPDERTKIDNLLDLAHTPLPTGGRKEVLLRFKLRELEDSIVKRFKVTEEGGWFLSFRDERGRHTKFR